MIVTSRSKSPTQPEKLLSGKTVRWRWTASGSHPGLAQFKDDDLQKLESGNSAYKVANGAAQPAGRNPDVRQGFLEMANVNPVHTMAMLIKTNRMFEFNTRALQAYKAMDEQCAREVGRV